MLENLFSDTQNKFFHRLPGCSWKPVFLVGELVMLIVNKPWGPHKSPQQAHCSQQTRLGCASSGLLAAVGLFRWLEGSPRLINDITFTLNFQASFFLLNQFSQYTFSTSITFKFSLIFNYHESNSLNLIHLTVLKFSTFHFDSDLIKRLKTATWTMQIQSREQVIKSPEVLFFSLLKINMR